VLEARGTARILIAVALAAAAAAALALGGCTGGGPRADAGAGPVLKRLSTSLTGQTGVTIAAAGDVNFGDGVTPTLTAGGLGYPFANVSGIFESADFSFVNLECAISSQGAPVGGKEFTFRGPADSAGALVDGGIRVVSLANNHSKDWGTAAFQETMAHLKEAGIAWCGAGNNAGEAYSPAVLTARGRKVAFVAFTGIIPDGWPATATSPGCATTTDRERVARTVREARAGADFVVASFHWGIELATSPNQEQRQLAHLAVDSGADLVLGHHPHVVQGFELYKNRLIAYSLGNYVFSPPREISSKTLTLVALLGENGLVQAKIVPNVISGCHPVVLSGAAASQWLGTVAGYSSGLGTTMKVSGGRGFISGAAAGAGGAHSSAD
jgi:poly-gamma-glutamate capsule biosynthesis protein CapA/YwtB (metallophosphatase superfamily)